MANIVNGFLVSCWKIKKTPLIDILITVAFMFKIMELENYIYIKLDFLKCYEIISEKFISAQCVLLIYLSYQ